MSQQIIYNLEEFAQKYQLKDIFGAYAAHMTVSGMEANGYNTPKDTIFFKNMVKERTLFTKLMLVRQGFCQMHIQNKVDLRKGSLLIVTSKETALIEAMTQDFEAEFILVDDRFVDNCTLFHLEDDKLRNVVNIFQFVRDIVRHPHINKVEMIKSMINVLKLFINELPYEQCTITRDLGHKKEIYEIFLHHLYCNFHKERQIRFYADKLNVSTAYLSRLVKEISGSTVNDHVTSLVYKEICNLLKQTDMTIGEIATSLNFSDQSALTNFFKLHSGMTPLAYRNKTI